MRKGFWVHSPRNVLMPGREFRFSAQIPEVREAHRPEVNRGIEASENALPLPAEPQKGSKNRHARPKKG